MFVKPVEAELVDPYLHAVIIFAIQIAVAYANHDAFYVAKIWISYYLDPCIWIVRIEPNVRIVTGWRVGVCIAEFLYLREELEWEVKFIFPNFQFVILAVRISIQYGWIRNF